MSSNVSLNAAILHEHILHHPIIWWTQFANIYNMCDIYIYIYVWNTPQETGRPKHKTDWRMNGLCHPGPLCSTSPEGLRELRNSGNEN